MADYIADYCRYLTEEKHAQANTINSYVRDLSQFQAWLMADGVTDLRKVRKEDVGAYLQHMSYADCVSVLLALPPTGLLPAMWITCLPNVVGVLSILTSPCSVSATTITK